MKADHDTVKRMLKTAKGQIEGIIKMVDDDRYCIDISNQLLATNALIKKVHKEVLNAHLKSCVVQSFEQGADVDKKIGEIIKVLDKLIQ